MAEPRPHTHAHTPQLAALGCSVFPCRRERREECVEPHRCGCGEQRRSPLLVPEPTARKSRCSQSQPPSRASTGMPFLPVPASSQPPGSPRVSTRSSPVGTRPTPRVRQLQLKILYQICKDLISEQGLILKFQTDMNFGGPCSTPYRTQGTSVPEGAPHEFMHFLPTSNAENLNKEGLSTIIDSTHFQEQG